MNFSIEENVEDYVEIGGTHLQSRLISSSIQLSYSGGVECFNLIIRIPTSAGNISI